MRRDKVEMRKDALSKRSLHPADGARFAQAASCGEARFLYIAEVKYAFILNISLSIQAQPHQRGALF